MDKRIYILLLLISYFSLISTSCAKQNDNNVRNEKQYNLILQQAKFHNIRYDIGDLDDDLILNEDEGERLIKSLYLLTNDSIYVALNISDYDNEFALYSIQEVDNLSLLLRYQYNARRDSLLFKLDDKNNILEINDNKYYINKSYTDYLKKEGFSNKSILPFASFIDPNLDDFYSFHDLVSDRWMEDLDNGRKKIIKAEIKHNHPQNEDIVFDFKVEYIYKGNNLAEIIEYDEDRDTLYHKKYVSSTDNYELYEYNCNDVLGRSYEEGNIFMDKGNMNDSINSQTTSVQRGQVDKSRSKIILHKEYPIKRLNLSKAEIENLISKDLISTKEN